MPRLQLRTATSAGELWIGVGAAILLLAFIALPLGSPLLTGAQDGTPTAGASPEAGDTLGLTREEPAPIGEEVTSENYGVTLIEVVQAGDAVARISEASPANPPPIEGYEYLLVRLRVRNAGNDQAPIIVGPANFGLTGTGNRLYPAPRAIAPEPALAGQLFTDGQAEGWLVLTVATGETNRELVLLPGSGDDPTVFRYLAVDPGASIPIREAATPQAVATPSTLGATQDVPAPPGETIETSRFTVEVAEFLRGDDATRALKQVTEFNPNPLPGNEHAVIRIRATYIGTDEGPVRITPADFGVIGASNIRYSQAALVPPVPDVNARLYPGGSVDGWLSFEIQASDPDLAIIFQEVNDPDASVRYLYLPDATASSAAPTVTETPAP